jgi:hypothetical protein
MSESFFDTYGVTDDGNDAETTGGDDGTSEAGEPYPNAVTAAYETLGDLRSDLGRALNGHPSDDVSVPGKDDNGERHPEGVAETWWVAVTEAKGLMGEKQRDENEFSVSDYRDAFGRTITAVEHEDLTEGEKSEMRKAGIDLDEVEMPRRVPCATTGRLPLFVTDGDELNEALELLDDFVNEVVDGEFEAHHDGTSEAGDDDDTTSEAGDDDMTGGEAIQSVLAENSDLAQAALDSAYGYRQDVIEAVSDAYGIDVTANQVSKAKAEVSLGEAVQENNDDDDTSEAGDDEADVDVDEGVIEAIAGKVADKLGN